MINILITGKNSYIGNAVQKHLEAFPDLYSVSVLDTVGCDIEKFDFSPYDCVFHVAGIAHSDSGKIAPEKEALYYSVNTDLAVKTAECAKAGGVKQFIFMSSAIVYGSSAPVGRSRLITKDSLPDPENCYSNSKLLAEMGILPLDDGNFKVVVLRPPMIYGKNSKGNFPKLLSLAKKLPVFPKVSNRRSMLYVESLAEFVRLMIQNGESGIFHPQNSKAVSTEELVCLMRASMGKKTLVLPGFRWVLRLLSHLTPLVNKAMGSMEYDRALGEYKQSYELCDFEESVRRSV